MTAKVSLLLGVIAFVLGTFPVLGFPGLAAAITGLILGLMAREKDINWLTSLAVIVNIIGGTICVWAILIVFDAISVHQENLGKLLTFYTFTYGAG